ncbi:MAG: TolC family protein [Myxococcales bacterium]|nr:TolC family protein [Myxococcales bacterium]
MITLFFVLLAAPPAGSLSLDDALRLAVERDPDLRAAGLRVQERETGVAAADGAFDLQLDVRFAASTERYTGDWSAEDIFINAALYASVSQPLVWGTTLQASLSNSRTAAADNFLDCSTCYVERLQLAVRQPLLRGFGREANEAPRRAAEHARDAASIERQRIAETSVENIVRTYVELGHARAEAEIRAAALALATELLAATDTRIEVGQSRPADRPVVAQAVARRRQELVFAERRRADAAEALAVKVGLDAVPDVALPPPAAFPDERATVLKAALAHSPELAAYDAEAKRLRAEQVRLDDAARPQLDVTLIASQSAVDDGLGGVLTALPDNNSQYYGATLALTFPPANTTAEAEQARGRLSMARNAAERESRADTLRHEAGDALRALRTAEQSVELTDEVARLATAALEAESAKLDLGQSTNLDVIQVQQDLAEAQRIAARARADRLVALAALRRLTGRLLEAHGLRLLPP